MIQSVITFDWENFKKEAERCRFFGRVTLDMADGELRLVKVEQTFQLKDANNFLAIATNVI